MKITRISHLGIAVKELDPVKKLYGEDLKLHGHHLMIHHVVVTVIYTPSIWAGLERFSARFQAQTRLVVAKLLHFGSATSIIQALEAAFGWQRQRRDIITV